MLVEVRLEGELAPTADTLVVLGGRMSLDVSSKVGPVSERLATVSTTERLLTRV